MSMSEVKQFFANHPASKEDPLMDTIKSLDLSGLTADDIRYFRSEIAKIQGMSNKAA